MELVISLTSVPLHYTGRRNWEDNIRTDLEEIGINTRNLVDSVQDRNYWRALVDAALNLRTQEIMYMYVYIYIYIYTFLRKPDGFQ